MTDGKEVSREEAMQHADSSPVLRRMLNMNTPLTRANYILLSANKADGDPWNAEDEADVPECFRDPDAVKPHPGLKQAKPGDFD